MEGNPDFHRSGALKSLLTEGEEVIRTARVSDYPNWLGRIPAVPFVVMALACGLGTLLFISRII
ncbi:MULTISPECIES: hypothetical protein [Brucella]|uniref:Uncharacterized protein n=1 Tax=Ochrobactrum soli TaxID=2448455 RepID=A0A2P9HBG5_9HYPH|nr:MULTISPECIES: hypothetical protein [Brucella]MCI1003095.1 hypothetical protein [Ochrobactrum sp. C6C9]MCR5944331.1 hypothetical protein [Ochrobactrum sp. XJ1]NVM43109.1 hypothetical protein [Brucella intermedia]SPL61385.1 hypothetical protein OHAE_4177 [[Ochrobactrum] soli]